MQPDMGGPFALNKAAIEASVTGHMIQNEDGKWEAQIDGVRVFGPLGSHKAVVAQFRAQYGEGAALFSDYAGMD